MVCRHGCTLIFFMFLWITRRFTDEPFVFIQICCWDHSYLYISRWEMFRYLEQTKVSPAYNERTFPTTFTSKSFTVMLKSSVATISFFYIALIVASGNQHTTDTILPNVSFKLYLILLTITTLDWYPVNTVFKGIVIVLSWRTWHLLPAVLLEKKVVINNWYNFEYLMVKYQ